MSSNNSDLQNFQNHVNQVKERLKEAHENHSDYSIQRDIDIVLYDGKPFGGIFGNASEDNVIFVDRTLSKIRIDIWSITRRQTRVLNQFHEGWGYLVTLLSNAIRSGTKKTIGELIENDPLIASEIRHKRYRIPDFIDLKSNIEVGYELEYSDSWTIQNAQKLLRTIKHDDFLKSMHDYQDWVLRRPLNKPIVITGIPGSGKTVIGITRLLYYVSLQNGTALAISPTTHLKLSMLRMIELNFPGQQSRSIEVLTLTEFKEKCVRAYLGVMGYSLEKNARAESELFSFLSDTKFEENFLAAKRNQEKLFAGKNDSHNNRLQELVSIWKRLDIPAISQFSIVPCMELNLDAYNPIYLTDSIVISSEKSFKVNTSLNLHNRKTRIRIPEGRNFNEAVKLRIPKIKMEFEDVGRDYHRIMISKDLPEPGHVLESKLLLFRKELELRSHKIQSPLLNRNINEALELESDFIHRVAFHEVLSESICRLPTPLKDEPKKYTDRLSKIIQEYNYKQNENIGWIVCEDDLEEISGTLYNTNSMHWNAGSVQFPNTDKVWSIVNNDLVLFRTVNWDPFNSESDLVWKEQLPETVSPSKSDDDVIQEIKNYRSESVDLKTVIQTRLLEIGKLKNLGNRVDNERELVDLWRRIIPPDDICWLDSQPEADDKKIVANKVNYGISQSRAVQRRSSNQTSNLQSIILERNGLTIDAEMLGLRDQWRANIESGNNPFPEIMSTLYSKLNVVSSLDGELRNAKIFLSGFFKISEAWLRLLDEVFSGNLKYNPHESFKKMFNTNWTPQNKTFDSLPISDKRKSSKTLRDAFKTYGELIPNSTKVIDSNTYIHILSWYLVVSERLTTEPNSLAKNSKVGYLTSFYPLGAPKGMEVLPHFMTGCWGLADTAWNPSQS